MESLKGDVDHLKERLADETDAEEIADIEQHIQIGEEVIARIERALAAER